MFVISPVNDKVLQEKYVRSKEGEGTTFVLTLKGGRDYE